MAVVANASRGILVLVLSSVALAFLLVGVPELLGVGVQLPLNAARPARGLAEEQASDSPRSERNKNTETEVVKEKEKPKHEENSIAKVIVHGIHLGIHGHDESKEKDGHDESKEQDGHDESKEKDGHAEAGSDNSKEHAGHTNGGEDDAKPDSPHAEAAHSLDRHREKDTVPEWVEEEEKDEAAAGHAEEGEEEVSPLMFTVAVLIALFLFVNVGLLYLVNYKDENVRSSIFKMISSTMSIFLAVTLNAALFSILLEQIIPAPFPRGLGIGNMCAFTEFMVGMCIFVGAFVFLNYTGHYFRDPQDISRFYAPRIIGAHITAFAGITCFGTAQMAAGTSESIFKHHHYLVVMVAFVCLIVLREISGCVREYASGGVMEIEAATNAPKEDDEWRAQVIEAEDDATSLILSFLISQVAIWRVTGELIPLHGGTEKMRSKAEIVGMFVCSIIAICCLGLAVFVRKHTSWMQKHMSNPTRGYNRCMENIQMISAMSMSWFLLIAGFWGVQRLLHGSLLDNAEMSKVANATILTMLAIVNVIFIDLLADKAEEDRGNNEKAGSLERILRALIDAYGLLVGLVWEKATDAAMEVIVEGNTELSNHRVISKVVSAIIMMVFLWTAWVKYIVPKAQKSWKGHQVDIELEWLLRRSLAEKGTLADDLLAFLKPHLDAKRLKTGYFGTSGSYFSLT